MLLSKLNRKIKLKSQQPWTAVSALLGLISVAQLADELWVPRDQCKVPFYQPDVVISSEIPQPYHLLNLDCLIFCITAGQVRNLGMSTSSQFMTFKTSLSVRNCPGYLFMYLNYPLC